METKHVKNSSENSDEIIQISFGQLLLSTLSAFIGVQSNANRERDFKYGKISHFILIGLLFGLVFVCTLVAVVNIVMRLTGN
jgi:Na+-transporting NADH:ubiquinone oxidoreductase subunit NqrB